VFGPLGECPPEIRGEIAAAFVSKILETRARLFSKPGPAPLPPTCREAHGLTLREDR
jgi:hypothetical protein